MLNSIFVRIIIFTFALLLFYGNCSHPPQFQNQQTEDYSESNSTQESILDSFDPNSGQDIVGGGNGEAYVGKGQRYVAFDNSGQCDSPVEAEIQMTGTNYYLTKFDCLELPKPKNVTKEVELPDSTLRYLIYQEKVFFDAEEFKNQGCQQDDHLELINGQPQCVTSSDNADLFIQNANAPGLDCSNNHCVEEYTEVGQHVWNKPSNVDADVRVECWGGGGGAHKFESTNGGGGGGYARAHFNLEKLPDTVEITIGHGGSDPRSNDDDPLPVTNGGESRFGDFAIAEGGKAGRGNHASGAGGTARIVTEGHNVLGVQNIVEQGGNGAGYREENSRIHPNGNNSTYAGAGGGSSRSGQGGVSLYGGNGGGPTRMSQCKTDPDFDCIAPGAPGGGMSQNGNESAGAGKCRITYLKK